jgi:hypothetical protein
VADLDAIRVPEPVRALHPAIASVQESTVGRDVMQPVAAIPVANFAMLPGDRPGRIWQGPVQVLIPADVEPPFPRDFDAQRAPVRQSGYILNLQSQRHPMFLDG